MAFFNAVTWGQCYDRYFCQFSPIFGEKIVESLKYQCYDYLFSINGCILSQKRQYIFSPKIWRNFFPHTIPRQSPSIDIFHEIIAHAWPATPTLVFPIHSHRNERCQLDSFFSLSLFLVHEKVGPQL
jgi:hypothetical protein